LITHYCTKEKFVLNVDGYLDLVKSGDRVEIDRRVVLIRPKDLRLLDKCFDVVDDLPVGIESLIDDEDEDEDGYNEVL